jgi:tetratricopeptide (TPR) repeat protein
MEDDVIKVTMNKAEVAYLKGDFESAIFWYNEVLEKNSEKVEAEFGVGVSSMGLSQFVDASESFSKVIEQDDNLFIQKAQWFQAGCFLAMDETDVARWHLNVIASDPNHYYSSDAAKILKRMKR